MLAPLPVPPAFLINVNMLMNPDRTLLHHLPYGIVLDPPLDLRFTHPHAITFCVLDGGPRPVVVMSRNRPHMFIYNALKKCDPTSPQAAWKTVLSDYGCEIVRGRLTRSVVTQFQHRSTKNHGFPRYAVISGRLWRSLRVSGMAPFSVITFWNPGQTANKTAAYEVICALRLRGRLFLISPSKRAQVTRISPVLVGQTAPGRCRQS